MSLIHDLYADDHDSDARYRSKLKQKIVEAFPEKLLFLTIDDKNPQVVVSSEGIYSKNMMGCNAMRHYCKRQLNIYKVKF